MAVKHVRRGAIILVKTSAGSLDTGDGGPDVGRSRDQVDDACGAQSVASFLRKLVATSETNLRKKVTI